MAQCAQCGADTDLYELDLPICPICVSERERAHPSLDGLSAQVSFAKESYLEAIKDFELHPSAVSLRERAERAGERYRTAVHAYDEALRREGG